MRAVYECNEPYRSVGYWDVNAIVPVLSEERVGENGVYLPRVVVATYINLPDSESLRNRFYYFYEGKKHNQLTLEDPVEIQNIREWLKYHPDFKEVYCEDVPEDLQGYIKSLKAGEPEKEQAEHKGRDNRNEDWDRVMEKRMMR